MKFKKKKFKIKKNILNIKNIKLWKFNKKNKTKYQQTTTMIKILKNMKMRFKKLIQKL